MPSCRTRKTWNAGSGTDLSLIHILPSGVPVRATLDVTFKASSDSDSLSRQSPLESPDRTKYRIFKEGEYLWNYANEEYGSPGMWREIAKANGIMDPLNVRPGQVLKLPAL